GAALDPARTVAELRELAELTGNEDGSQRVAWTDTWATARRWMRERLEAIDSVTVETDRAGNVWATLPGERDDAVLMGGHIDLVPNGGWLDGALNVVGGMEVLRALSATQRPLTVKLVDWADEEGARFGRSLMGSSAAAGTLHIDEVRDLTDRDGIALPDALRGHEVDLEKMGDARRSLAGARAYLELHIEQGPVLEKLGQVLGVVLGTFGVERHAIRFGGRHAHAGATPMDLRQDAFLAAARSALAFREDTARREDVRATTGIVRVSPGIVTAFNGSSELSLDQRALDGDVLADMLDQARSQSEALAREEGCTVEWERVWQIEPILFDPDLIELGEAAVTEVTGTSYRLPSGPLHDAASMAPLMPTVMLFVRSLGGVSHTKEEDTPVEDLEMSVRALHGLALRTFEWASRPR
ncbi:MAG: Zn-dependent hydrolase, partial [Solirubrobacterales bacterium]|nr:Zn-dependent hydrolase [Solirubrobacterales bacterium]